MTIPNSFQSLPKGEPGAFLPGGASESLNPPLSNSTTGYRLNHFALRVSDPSRSLHFYVDLLGMRVVFSMNAGPFTIYYLGHPPADTADLGQWAHATSEIPLLTRTSGLLELYHVHGETDSDSKKESVLNISTGNEPPNLGFAHLGFTVPDVTVAVERLRAAGVSILKDVGVCSREAVPLSDWEAQSGIGRGDIHGNYAWFFEKFAMVADPVSFLYIFIWMSLANLLRMGIWLN